MPSHTLPLLSASASLFRISILYLPRDNLPTLSSLVLSINLCYWYYLSITPPPSLVP